MTKMNMPEMKAVRFKDSDVIVSSGKGPNYMTLKGFGDTISGNAYYVFDGTDYAVNGDINSFLSAFNHANRTNITSSSAIDIYNAEGHHATNLAELPTWDAYDVVGPNPYNGDYVWNSTSLQFEHKNS